MTNSEFDRDVQKPGEVVQAIPLEASKGDYLAQVLSRALHAGPHMRYALPDEAERQTVLYWFLTSAIRAAELCGASYTNSAMNGGAVWVGSNSEGIRRIAQDGLLSTGFRLTLVTMRRCVRLVASLERVRRRLVRSRHWYLIALGVEHRQDRNADRAALLRPMLYRADYEGVPCYVEAFEEQDISFYEEYGFRIEGGGRICEDGPAYWAMLRSPRQRSSREKLVTESN
jgi:hypothetical protein